MARSPRASFDNVRSKVASAEAHPLQADHDAEVSRLEELKLNPANSWHIEKSEERIAALADVINS